MPARVLLVTLALLFSATAARGLAQGVSHGAACDGSRVSHIRVRTHPPEFSDTGGVRGTIQQAERERHAITNPDVIFAYLRLDAGEACTERERAESERLLRAQPFLAAASVRTLPDGRGRSRVDVETVDEVPIIFAGRLSGGTLGGLTLGTANFLGRGLTIALSYENGFAYRTGFGARVVQYGAFGGPFTLTAAGERAPLGEAWSLGLSEPFLTDLQSRGFHVGGVGANEYYNVVRPVGDDHAMYVHRMTYDAGMVWRIGRGRTVGVFGGALMGEDIRTGSSPVLLSDSGLITLPNDPELSGRYSALSVARLAVVAGVRALRFVTARGFDALTATQDVGVGLQIDAMGGSSLRAPRTANDEFFSGSLYWGAGDAHSFAQLRAVVEGRIDHDSHRWGGVVANGRLFWYTKPSDARTRVASAEYALIRHLAFPLQLTFRDVEGGLHGFGDATYAGGTRAVARIEDRRAFRLFGPRADCALAGFAEAGMLWAGDAPYGRYSGVHSAVGVSLLSAFPSGGKQTYRIDVALPVNPAGGAGWEVRFTSADRTRLLWTEAGDVARARTGAVPSNLLSWLPR